MGTDFARFSAKHMIVMNRHQLGGDLRRRRPLRGVHMAQSLVGERNRLDTAAMMMRSIDEVLSSARPQRERTIYSELYQARPSKRNVQIQICGTISDSIVAPTHGGAFVLARPDQDVAKRR